MPECLLGMNERFHYTSSSSFSSSSCMVLRRFFGPWPHYCWGFEIINFLRSELQSPTPNPQARGPEPFFVRHLAQNLSGMVGRTSSQGVANIAFEFTGARKLHLAGKYARVQFVQKRLWVGKAPFLMYSQVVSEHEGPSVCKMCIESLSAFERYRSPSDTTTCMNYCMSLKCR